PETAETKLTLGTEPEKTDCEEYAPQNNPLILQVKIRRSSLPYRFYHQFKRDGLALQNEKGSPCEYCSFFSYIPMYAQLSASQKEYYLYFRDMANRGEYIQTNPSYILLYIFEIINLPEVIPPEVGRERLTRLWLGVRHCWKPIDKYMSQWLADYCLLHRLPCPTDLLLPILPDILRRASLKEFYLEAEGTLSGCQVDALLKLASDYSYRQSRYAVGDNIPLFAEHIEAAAKLVLEKLLTLHHGRGAYGTVTKRYNAFCGALCAEDAKAEMEITYYSVSGTEPLRATVTAAVKYAENKLRAFLSVKSRLSVPAFPEEYRSLVDNYFDVHLKKSPVEEKRAAYEALYDAPDFAVSAQSVAEIEKNSWDNTLLLVPEEERREMLLSPEESRSVCPVPEIPQEELTPEEKAFLLQVSESGVASTVQNVGLARRVNEKLYETFGDTPLFTDERRITVFDDYADDVKEYLREHP
ncbi:MAG: TerB N-terminal domain-containing protein, partial [Clostridia bacterium]|nr:TerB N-terminal domain-containing protein [Clostridia bacterium]